MEEIIAGVYKILQRLGSGGGGVVYLAEHMRLQKKVVLKQYSQKITKDEDFLRREVNTLKDLKHPYIPQVYDFFTESGKVYAVIDYVPGESLDKALKRGERFSQPQVIKWGRELLEALSYLHSPTHGDPPRGYVHSDIKPANIMRTPEGDICLIDFNIAFALGEDAFIGMTPGYASPEHYGIDYTSYGPDSLVSRSPQKGSPSEDAPGMRAENPGSPPLQSAETQDQQRRTRTDAETFLDSRQTASSQDTATAFMPSSEDETLADAVSSTLPEEGYGAVPETEKIPFSTLGNPVLAGTDATVVSAAGTDATAFSGETEEDSPPKAGREPASGHQEVAAVPAATAATGKNRYRIVPDVRSDIYSVGATLYHLLSGVRPARDALDVVPLSKEDFSPMLVDVITKAMSPNPDLRYQTAAEMLEAFDQLYTRDPRVLRLKRQSRFTYASLAVLLAAGIATSFVGLKRIQTMDAWLRSVEYSKNALEEGDVSSAVDYAMGAIPERTGLLTPAAPAAAQAALAEALGVYDLSDGFKTYDALRLPSAPLFLAMAPDGSSVACICASQTLVFNTVSGARVAALPTIGSALAEVRYLDNHTILYAGAEGLTAYDLSAEQVLWRGRPATGIALSSDGTRVAAVDRDEGLARVYDSATGELVTSVDFGGRGQRVAENDAAANPQDNLLALNENGTLLAASFSDGSLVVFNLREDENSLICLDSSDFVHFEGGFSGRYFAYSATGGGNSRFAVIDCAAARQTGGFTSTMPFLVRTDETGIYVATENVLVEIDPESGDQREIAYTPGDILAFCKRGDYTAVSTQEGEISFFGPRGALLSALPGSEEGCFLALAGEFAVEGNRNDALARLYRIENHPEAQVFTYDPAYDHSEARLSADGKRVMLYRYDRFRLYGVDGTILADAALPDPESVYDQQFRRDEGGDRLEVSYNDGRIRSYSAEDGSLISETAGTPPEDISREEYLTDTWRIDAPLHGAPVVYDAATGREIARLERDDYLTDVTQSGDYVITEYVTAEGSRYGLVLDEDCQVIASVPNLCDILENGILLTDDRLGNIRQTHIFTADELVSMVGR